MIEERLELADWRRQISELYATIRAGEDPVAAWALWKQTRDRLYRSHSQSPIPAAERGDATAPEYYAYDPALRTTADIEAADGATFELPDSAAGHVVAERAGTARFLLQGEHLSLSVFWLLDYAGGFFVSFRDATCGTETYGAGRYVLDTAKGADLGDGRRPGDPRLQLRVSAVVQLRPAVELPAPASGELAHAPDSRWGAVPRLISTLAVTRRRQLSSFSLPTRPRERDVCEPSLVVTDVGKVDPTIEIRRLREELAACHETMAEQQRQMTVLEFATQALTYSLDPAQVVQTATGLAATLASPPGIRAPPRCVLRDLRRHDAHHRGQR